MIDSSLLWLSYGNNTLMIFKTTASWVVIPILDNKWLRCCLNSLPTLIHVIIVWSMSSFHASMSLSGLFIGLSPIIAPLLLFDHFLYQPESCWLSTRDCQNFCSVRSQPYFRNWAAYSLCMMFTTWLSSDVTQLGHLVTLGHPPHCGHNS